VFEGVIAASSTSDSPPSSWVSLPAAAESFLEFGALSLMPPAPASTLSPAPASPAEATEERDDFLLTSLDFTLISFVSSIGSLCEFLLAI